MNFEALRFMPQSTLVSSASESYRPPCFPPPDDWVITVGTEGQPQSRYGDPYWDYSAFGYHGFNFGKHNLSTGNLRLVKQALVLIIYSRLFPGNIKSCERNYTSLIKIAKVCDHENILISQVSQFPAIHPKIVNALQNASYTHVIRFLHRLILFKNQLGFVIADERTLAYLANAGSKHEPIQHPYIPPRIWSYQINRLKECIDDFRAHEDILKTTISEIGAAYEYNKGLPTPGTISRVSPFREIKGYKSQIVFSDSFEDMLQDRGLLDLFNKWLGSVRHIGSLTKYLTLVRNVALFYVLNFSLQRRGEVSSLRCDCFQSENDPKLGKIGLINGETTKTDTDSDARWVVPLEVEDAINSAATIARWRMEFHPKNTPEDVVENPYLLTPVWEPWNKGTKRSQESVRSKNILDYGVFLNEFPVFFDQNKIKVTEKDWTIAISITPMLDRHNSFGIGKPWRFSLHQLRRTTCINMFSSGLVSESSIQWSMKHLNRYMTLYYGRNYSNMRLNSDTETAVIFERYRAIYRQLCDVVKDTVDFVRPHKKEMIPSNIIRLVDTKEEKKLISLIKKGATGCRRTLLGFCMKNSACEYGGIESVAKCAGADGKGICADAIFDRRNKAKLIKLKDKHKRSLEDVDKHSSRASAAMQEIYAIEVYLNVINRK